MKGGRRMPELEIIRIGHINGPAGQPIYFQILGISKGGELCVNGKEKYRRIFIQRVEPQMHDAIVEYVQSEAALAAGKEVGNALLID